MVDVAVTDGSMSLLHNFCFKSAVFQVNGKIPPRAFERSDVPLPGGLSSGFFRGYARGMITGRLALDLHNEFSSIGRYHSSGSSPQHHFYVGHNIYDRRQT